MVGDTIVGDFYLQLKLTETLCLCQGNVAATQIHKTRESKQEQKMAHADSVKSLHDTNSYLLS